MQMQSIHPKNCSVPRVLLERDPDADLAERTADPPDNLPVSRVEALDTAEDVAEELLAEPADTPPKGL